ncbi:MAG: ATP-binding protein, partial [Lachnospiraceae bacterium]|nr:ATP-binding protein [Lachnospiraceae bacterium]
PMQEAYIHGYWDDLARFTGNFFQSTFKTNEYLERAIMTGITRVSKESVFSELNNLEVVTTTSNKYEDCFGFTQKEVSAALAEYGLEDQAEKVKSWYDGFTFGNLSDIYNPWSVLNYLDKRILNTYWANTSSNALIDRLIREGEQDVKIAMENLLKGESLFTQIDEQIVFSQLNSRTSAVWSLMLASGYLKVLNHTIDEERGTVSYELSLTNKEVRILFESMIHGWFADYTPAYNEFVRAMLNGDIQAMNVYMNRVALATFSFFDTGKKPSGEAEPERFYHGFVLGLLVDLADRYRMLSNRESGFGRYDVMLEPVQDQGKAILLEFKVFDPQRETSLDDTAKEALRQIEDRKYAAALHLKGIHEDRILKYGFAFEGKKVLIRKAEPLESDE